MWVSGGVQPGSLGERAEPRPAEPQPARPAGIPEHYVFDHDAELWMPPSAVQKERHAESRDGSVVKKDLGGGAEIVVIKSSANNPSPYSQSSSNEPICFEFTNSGTCSRLARGEICRYRHLDASHPDVIRDKVKQGKLPVSSLGGIDPASPLQAVLANPLAALAPGALSVAGLPDDPGPSASLCFDFVNNGTCPRLAAGDKCKYRHLPPHHPDVIADRIKQGKLNPLSAATLIAAGGSVTLSQALAQQALAQQPLPQVNNPATIAAIAATIPDPGPGFQLCFDFVNRGACSRLQRGEVCRYRHLPPNHPEVIADKIKQGKSPGVIPLSGMPPSATSTSKPAIVQAYAGADAAPKSRRRSSRSSSLDSDDGRRYRERDRARSYRDRRGSPGRYDSRRHERSYRRSPDRRYDHRLRSPERRRDHHRSSDRREYRRSSERRERRSSERRERRSSERRNEEREVLGSEDAPATAVNL